MYVACQDCSSLCTALHSLTMQFSRGSRTVRLAANYCRPKVRSTAGVSSKFGKMTDSARQKAACVIMVCQLTDSIRHGRDSPSGAKR